MVCSPFLFSFYGREQDDRMTKFISGVPVKRVRRDGDMVVVTLHTTEKGKRGEQIRLSAIEYRRQLTISHQRFTGSALRSMAGCVR